MYEIIETLNGQVLAHTNDDGTISFIPFDEANTDYQTYLAWKAEQ